MRPTDARSAATQALAVRRHGDGALLVASDTRARALAPPPLKNSPSSDSARPEYFPVPYESPVSKRAT